MQCDKSIRVGNDRPNNFAARVILALKQGSKFNNPPDLFFFRLDFYSSLPMYCQRYIEIFSGNRYRYVFAPTQIIFPPFSRCEKFMTRYPNCFKIGELNKARARKIITFCYLDKLVFLNIRHSVCIIHHYIIL